MRTVMGSGEPRWGTRYVHWTDGGLASILLVQSRAEIRGDLWQSLASPSVV
jgi:hypothetical protein